MFSFGFPSRRRVGWKVLFLFLGVGIVILIFSIGRPDTRKPRIKTFKFDLKNTPYKDLKNSHCISKNNGEWDCPDIRTQGTNKLRQSQLVATRLLLIFDSICRNYGLRYWVTRGTLLGAVRHAGHIPWDSDLDVEMPVEDYVDFVRKGAKDLPIGTTLQRGPKERDFDFVFLGSTQYSNNNIKSISKALKTPSNPRLRDEHSCYKYCLKFNCSWPDGIMFDIYPIEIENGFFIDQFAVERASSTLLIKTWRFLLKIAFGYNSFEYQAFPLTFFKFEGFNVPVLKDWKKLLTNNYGGNYMELPPKEAQRPPDDLVPDPLHSCTEFDKEGRLLKWNKERAGLRTRKKVY